MNVILRWLLDLFLRLTRTLDWPLLAALLALMGMGLAVLHSAGSGNSALVQSQAARYVIGLGVMWVLSRIPPPALRRATPAVYAVSLLPLLAVLFIGTLWLPVTFALYTAQSLVFAFDGGFILGRAPMHALFVGFFGSLLVAMVTRVTQGHSGQPLTMYPIAWFAFVAIQIVATVRILADVLPDPGLWQALAAVGWLLALSPWVMRIGHIYLTPRRDGRPG